MSLFVCAAEPQKRLRINRQLLLMAVVLVGLSSLAFSSTVAVGICTTLPFYLSIQTAVNSVPAGSTIKICPGKYGEQVLITKNLTLTGVAANGLTGTTAAGENDPVITSPTNGVVLNIPDPAGGDPIYYQIAVVSPVPTAPIKVNISNIAVDGSNNQIAGCGMDLVGINYQNASGVINHVVTRNYVVGIGATPLIAQNGIQVSGGATGSVKSNTITDDVYINPSDCSATAPPYCYGSSGILVYDSGSTSSNPLTISSNTISNTQLAIVTYGDSAGTADYNTVTSNKITGTLAAGVFLDDGIDLCSNYNTATSNTVFNSSGSGIHIDSTCTESSGASGIDTVVTTNTINEACAGVLLGNGGGNIFSGNVTYDVLQTTFPGDSCPVSPSRKGSAKMAVKLRPLPLRR
jgi:hypothetical protein